MSRRRIDDPSSGGILRNRKRVKDHEDDEEPPHTLKDQIMHLRTQNQVQATSAPDPTPLPSPGDLPEAVQAPAPPRKEKERPTVIQVVMEAPHGVIEVTGKSGEGSSTARIPLTEGERAHFMSQAAETHKVSIRKDKWGAIATMGASLLSFAALGVLLVGAASTLSGSGKKDD